MSIPKVGSISAALLLAAGGIAMVSTGLRPNAHAHSAHKYEAGEPGDPAKPFRVIEVAMTEAGGTLAFVPAEIEVNLGEQIKFVLKNAGTLNHEFFLDSFEKNAKHKIEMEKNPEMEHDDPNAKRLAANASADIVWKFSKPGRFEFACLIPGHYEAGMHGVVIVK